MRYAMLTLLLLALACSKKPESEETTETDSPTSQASTTAADKPETPTPSQAATPEPTPIELELVAAGEAPLAKLGWSFEKGAKQTLQIRSEASAQAQIGAKLMPKSSAPAISHALQILIEEIEADGSARAVFSIEDGGIDALEDTPEQLTQQLLQAQAELKGWKGRFSVSPQGVVSGVETDIPEGSSAISLRLVDGIERQLHFLTLPLPDEEVGKGAKWTVTRPAEEAGVRGQETLSIELESVENGTARFSVETLTEAGSQVVSPRGAGPNARFQLADYSGKSKGTAVMKLTQLVPISYERDLSSVTTVVGKGPDGKPQVANFTQETQLALTTK